MLISVIIPVYNREKTVKKAIESVLNQSYKDIEVLIVDDCSTDKSVEIVKSIKDDRIKIITCEKNGGACKARNIGIEKAKGMIIAFHDSDDCWHEDKLKKSIEALEREEADMVFSALNRTENNRCTIVPKINLNSEKDKLGKLLECNCVSTQTIVLKKKVVEEIRFDERLPRFQDWDFALQILQKGYKIYFIEEPLVDCWVLGDSITSNIEKGIQAYKILEKKYETDFKHRKKALYEHYYHRATFLEKGGRNGADSFKKAYDVAFTKQMKRAMLFRYVLAKVRMYKFMSMVFETLKFNKEQR